MRVLNIILAMALSAFMLFNGIYESLTGKYFGAQIPRPWIDMVGSLGVNALTVGPFLVIWGLAWLYFASLLWSKKRHAFIIGVLVSISTLWYFPFGTIISFISIGLLRSNKKPSDLLR